MIIQPRIRGFLCVTTHPEGCARNVRDQIDAVRGAVVQGPRHALVIGASTGYGLASRIAAAFGAGAATTGLFFERPPSQKRPGTAGWYNTAAFHAAAEAEGLWARSINGDAFSDAARERTVELLREAPAPVDLVVYSLAAPRRTHPRTGVTHQSVLKPIGEPYTSRTVDTDRGVVTDVTIEPATEDEIRDTVAVMGGEDWEFWMDALLEAGVLAEGARAVAFTYVGPRLTWPIYWEGTIGRAKKDLERAASAIDARLRERGGRAVVSVMKAVVTQASAAIPVVPLYMSTLFRVMKEKGLHEGCIEQARRLLAERLPAGGDVVVDETGRIRLDDLEMRDDVQAEVEAIWPTITTENLRERTDFDGYRAEFLRLFGFGRDDVDYDADVDPAVDIPGLVTL